MPRSAIAPSCSAPTWRIRWPTAWTCHSAPEPSLVAPNLWAQETDIYNNLQTHWGLVQEWLNAILRWSGEVDSLIADELTVLPGMDELANLLWINRHRESGRST